MIFNLTKFNSHWNTKSLKQLGSFNRGKSKHRPRNDRKLFENGKYPLIQTGEVKEANIFITGHNAEYSDFGLFQSKLWPKNTLCITIAANIAETAILSYPMCFPDSVVGFNADSEECSEIYMHYIFTYIKREIKKRIGGSIQDNINIEYLTNLNFKIPETLERKSIEFLLFSIDKKIELNNRINAELESMAKLIYDYWFVQFDFPDSNGKPYKSSGGKMVWNEELKREIPEGWEVKKLDKVVSKTGTGLNPRDNFKLGSGNNYYITIKSVKNGKIIFDDKCDKIDDDALKIIDKRSDLQPGDILFTSIEPVGVTYLIHEKPLNWNINESVFTVRANYNQLTSEYLYLLLSGIEMKAYSKNVVAGSIHKGIRHSVLKDFKFAYSNKNLIDKYSEKVKPILSRINILDKENARLIELRDWLLPMLMNGQVTVGDTEE